MFCAVRRTRGLTVYLVDMPYDQLLAYLTVRLTLQAMTSRVTGQGNVMGEENFCRNRHTKRSSIHFQNRVSCSKPQTSCKCALVYKAIPTVSRGLDSLTTVRSQFGCFSVKGNENYVFGVSESFSSLLTSHVFCSGSARDISGQLSLRITCEK